MDRIIFITSFRDIGREGWSSFKRTVPQYISYFKILAENIDYKLLVFVSRDIRQRILDSGLKLYRNIEFVELSNVSTFYDKYLVKERQIMNSETYKNLIPVFRKNNPEHIYPEYTLVNHSKVNLVVEAERLYPNYKFYSWIDFGCTQHIDDCPKFLNLNYLDDNKVLYIQLKPITERKTAIQMLKDHNEYIAGSQFIVGKKVLAYFLQVYEDKLKTWQNSNICDDDQALVYQLYLDNPNMFYFFQTSTWFSLFRNFLNDTFPLSDKNEFHHLINHLDLNGSFIEIGVARGSFSKYLLQNTKVNKLYLVDPYRNFDDEVYRDAMNKYNMDAEMNICKENLKEFSDRIEFIRLTSSEATTTFKDNSQDFVYIDGNHEYSFVMEDLENYWKKVKVGGILSGDDFYSIIDDKNELIFWDKQTDTNKSCSWGVYGVGNAVKDFCNKYNLKYYKFSTQFYIFKV